MREIDRLSRLLDERGVDHISPDRGTVMWIDRRGCLCTATPEFAQDLSGDRVVVRQIMTAAEAVAATLDGTAEIAILKRKKPAGATRTDEGEDEA